MYVYKSKYNAFSNPSIYNKNVIIPTTQEQIQFSIYVIPHNVSLYSVLENTIYFSNLSMMKSQCYIYIVLFISITNEVLYEIEKYIHNNIQNCQKSQDCTVIEPYECLSSPREAIDAYKNLTLFFSSHSNDIFLYDNYKNNMMNTIDCHDSKITYTYLNNRHDFSHICGKCTKNNEVLMFNMYPVAGGNKVYILPPEFYILKESNNKVAIMNYNNFIFWIITSHSFINDNKNPIEIASTKFCPKSQSIEDMAGLFDVFNKYKFTNSTIMNTAIVGEDSENSILMFVGIYDLQFANKYTKYFEMLILK